MKLIAFRPREDERRVFEKLAEAYNIDIKMVTEPLTIETVNLAKEYDGVSIDGEREINREILDALVNQGIRVLSTRSIGYNHIDIEYAKQIGIKVCNSTYAPNGVSEYTVMLMLMAIRRFKETFLCTEKNNYSIHNLMGKELKDLTVGVVGTGRIGQSVIENLSGFGCEILTYDLTINTSTQRFAQYVEWDELLEKADIISLHLPLNKNTHHIINKKEIEKMKDGVILINCSRGELMDTNALLEGIESKKIGALGLDVIEGESEFFRHGSDEKIRHLIQFENVILTPHIAFYTDVAVTSMVESSVNGIITMIQGQPWINEI